MSFNNAKDFDLVILGAGFSGLTAVREAFASQRNFCVIARDYGATRHFSGAFDLIDPRWAGDRGEMLFKTDLSEHFANFVAAHPKHLYARLARGGDDATRFGTKLLAKMKSVLDFYDVPHRGDGKLPVAVFGSTGRIKPTAFAMTTHGLSGTELGSVAACLGFPSLTEYPLTEITKNLSAYFPSVTPIALGDWPVNRTSVLASLMSAFDREGVVEDLIQALKGKLGAAKILFIPPVLGKTRYLKNHAALEQSLGVRVIELLSSLPSAAGLRFYDAVEKCIADKKIKFLRGEVSSPVVKEHKIQSVDVCVGTEPAIRVSAKEFILASGKFLGGGIAHAEHFKEPLFQLPLGIAGSSVDAGTHITQLIVPNGADRQPFLTLGIMTDADGRPVYREQVVLKNLKASGHVLAGFDFSRDRCGFGVSVASASALLTSPSLCP